jgi:hypothetical protein
MLMKRCGGFRELAVKISFIITTQLFVIIAIAIARDDAPPSPVRALVALSLPEYERALRQYQPTEAERRYLPAIVRAF